MKVKVYHFGIHMANIYVNGLSITDVLERAWRLTQNIDGSWSVGPNYEDGQINMDYNPAIKVIEPLQVIDGKTYGHRSSMVGDIFEINDQKYEVDVTGFKELTNEV